MLRVLLLGALGAVHPRYYHVNVGHAILAGGCRWPHGAYRAFGPGGEQRGGAVVHTPLRPFGTHAYAISERGARKLLRACPRANYHVDVVAWGMRSLRLFAVHPLHFLYAKFHADIAPIGGHDGYGEPSANGDFHYLHHHKFECNYGVPFPINFDKIFGSYVDFEEFKANGGKMPASLKAE